MSKEELIRQLRVSLAAHKLLMLENYGRPDCKSCALAESVDEILFRADKPDTHDHIAHREALARLEGGIYELNRLYSEHIRDFDLDVCELIKRRIAELEREIEKIKEEV